MCVCVCTCCAPDGVAKFLTNCSELEYKWALLMTIFHPSDSGDSGCPEGLNQLNNRMLQFLRLGNRT